MKLPQRRKSIIVLALAIVLPLLAHAAELSDQALNYFSVTQMPNLQNEEPIYKKPVFAKESISQLPTNKFAEVLGWVPTDQNICGGYYQEPTIVLKYPNPGSITKGTTTITATLPSLFSQSGTSVLQGHVTVTQPGRELTADRAYLLRDPKTGKMSAVELVGNVHMREAGKLVVGQYAYVDLKKNTALLRNSVYRLATANPNGGTINAWGTVDQGERESNGILNFWHATYSTCQPTTSTWRMSAGHLRLDKKTGVGKAINTVLKIKGIPVFYFPYFSFPIDHRRKSGFLFPTFGYSATNGIEFAVPFYLNLAPNYDATITENFMGLRGLQQNLLFRYLTNKNSGALNFSILPNDQEFAQFKQDAPTNFANIPNASTYLSRLAGEPDTRSFVSYSNTTTFNPHWASQFGLNYVTDDYYFQDFGTTPALTTTDQLKNDFNLRYQGEHWHFLGSLLGYQTLHPINEFPVQNQYSRLPELDLNGDYPDEWLGLDYQLKSQFVYFNQGTQFAAATPSVTGERFHVDPSISLPFANMSGYFTPQLQLDTTSYDLTNQTPGLPTSISRFLPLFDIDSGLYFDRDMKFAGHEYRQTLEPRVFYLFVPADTNQNNIPLFDTTLPPLSYEQMFDTNRFTGIDRIGDANQVTMALTTRFLDDVTGEEKLRASIGQIYLFQRHRVVCDNINCMPDPMADQNFSPLVGELSYYLNPNWNVTTDAAWSTNKTGLNNTMVNVTYNHAKRIFNLGYYFVKHGDIEPSTIPANVLSLNPEQSDNLSRITLGTSLPLTQRWSALANWSYNINYSRPQNYFYGAEYDSCCWALRFIVSRNLTTINQFGAPQFNTVYYVQLQLKGLGNIGNSAPGTLLASGLPGYHDNFQGGIGL